jgi:predicted permease
MIEWLRRVWYLLNRSRLERELEEEMAAHRAEKGDRGPRFGNTLRLREESHDQWGWAWLDRLGQDVSFALRLLRGSPAFTFAAISVLTLGVGVNLAGFQVFNTVALSPLPVRDAETLVRLNRRSPTGTGTQFSYPAFDFYRTRAQSFATTFGLAYATVTVDDESQQKGMSFVTTNYLSDLGATPRAGRLLLPADDLSDAPSVVVLKEQFWRTQFGANPEIVGKQIRLNGRSFTVSGILPATFVGLSGSGGIGFAPLSQYPRAFAGSTILGDARGDALTFFARLKPGVSATAAEAELRPLVDALREQQPQVIWKDEWLGVRSASRLVPLDDMEGPGLALASSLVLLVLVTACMNLGLLLLARAISREREFSIRLSVGATRARIARQLLTENAVIAIIGTGVGCAVSVVASRMLSTSLSVPEGMKPTFDFRVGLAALALAAIACLVFGFAPAMQVIRPARRRARSRGVLVAIQVGAACVLIILSTLLSRGLLRVSRVPLGFEYKHTLIVDPRLDSYGFTPAAARAYVDALGARVQAIPGVATVALEDLPPFGNRMNVNAKGTVFHHVTPHYFDAMRIRLMRGRIFGASERGVVVISETLARRTWPNEDPLGKIFNEATVIGIVGDARTIRIADAGSTESYQPINDGQLSGAVMIVRANASPSAVAQIVASTSRSIDSRVSPSVTLLASTFEDKLETPKQLALITSALGTCALLLAVAGLAGLVSFTVSQRVKEIGIRVALGARSREIVGVVARQFTRPLVAGLVIGFAVAGLAATALSQALFGLSPVDPISYLGAALLFTICTGLGALPALLRAVRVDPLEVLRHE